MCDPVSIGFAVTAASSVLGYQEQKDASEENAKNATDAALSSYRQLEQREFQEREATAASIRDVVRQSQQASGQVRAAASAGNVAGRSVQTLLADFERQQLEHTSARLREQRFAELDRVEQRLGIQAQAQGRINELPRPSPLALGLQIAGAGLEAFGKKPKVDTDLTEGVSRASTTFIGPQPLS
jgi:hypothetical protein